MIPPRPLRLNDIKMKYYSTNNNSPKVDFKEATIQGQAPDKGLYFPERIPHFSEHLKKNISNWSNESIAYNIIAPFVGDSIPSEKLEEIIAETINFEFPLVQLDETFFALELFHGPTLAFKDVGARFMSRCLGYFVRNHDKQITVLVATSGDTGGAVANGFFNVAGVNVVILYPSGKVSSIQELQLTTLGMNISAIEVDGSFDDCQKMVKLAFADEELQKKLFLTSANSINVARWLPQQFYYAFAVKQWKEKNAPVVSVPSGNFGNICAGLIAHASGLNIQHFIAACNANDTVPEYFDSGIFQPKRSVATISNAMDVGNPSNFVRILELFDQQFDNLKTHVSGYSIDDDSTREIIARVFEENKYLLDPHGAVGYLALKKYLRSEDRGVRIGKKGIFLETAHPIKFFDVIEPVIGEKIKMPREVELLQSHKKHSVKMNADYDELRSLLLGN